MSSAEAVCTCYLGHQHGPGDDCPCTTSIVECQVHGLGKPGATNEEVLAFYTSLQPGHGVLPFELDSLDDVEKKGEAEENR